VLLLVTIFLVVIGTISLVIGFWQSSLLPIYISIACSVLAAAVLLIFSRMTSKSEKSGTGYVGPAPLDVGPARSTGPEPVSGFSGSGRPGSSPGETFAPAAPYGAPAGDDTDDDDFPDDDFPDDDFPIERYDSRRVGEILPLLAELDLDELDLVREREEQGKSRATVLARIDQLIDRLEAEDQEEEAHRFEDKTAPRAAGPSTDPLDEADDADHADDVVTASVVGSAAPSRTTQAVSVVALAEDDGYFPIEDYDDLRANEILPLLPELDDDELVMVRERERSTSARPSILRRIDAQLGSDATSAPQPVAEVAAPPEPPVAAAPVATKRAAAKRAPTTRKVAATKAVPTKKATPAATAAPAKKAATKRTVASKAVKPPPAVSEARTAAPTKRAAATKAPAAKRVPSEKVAPAKSATSSGGGAPAATKVAKATRKTSKR